MKRFHHSRERAIAAVMFFQSRNEKSREMSEIAKRKPPTPEEIRAGQKAHAERERQKGQASLPAIVPPEPSLPAKPAIDGADAYFQRAAVGMAPGRMFKPNGKERGYTFVDDGAAVPEGTPYVVQSDGIWVGQHRFHGEGVPPSHEGGLIFGDPNFRIPARDELGDLDPSEWPIGKFTNMAEDPWRPTIYVPLEDRSSGTIVTLILSGATEQSAQIIAGNGLLNHCRSVRRRAPDKLPIVMLATGSYRSKKFGMQKKPAFRFVGLAPRDSTASPDTSLSADMNDEIPYLG
jgi:hypothetical protein